MTTPIIQTRRLNLYYGSFHALTDIDIDLEERKITALIGPSGCGKSTLVRVFNRMNDLIEGVHVTGDVRVHGEEIFRPDVDLIALRKRVGMVFQRPNPFPLSVAENITFGLQIHRSIPKKQFPEVVEEALRNVLLWDDLKDRLRSSALSLSLEQQQRLCIARVLATDPQVILMDEPASALDPVSTLRIEELMRELREAYTIVIVTHNMQQAARVSDVTAFFTMAEDRAGYLVEVGPTGRIFTRPNERLTEDYISGRFG